MPQSESGSPISSPVTERDIQRVWIVARKLKRRLPPFVEIGDLVGWGTIGLIDALRKFDPGRDITFGTYSEFRIAGAMLDGLRKADWLSRGYRAKTRKGDCRMVKISTETLRTEPSLRPGPEDDVYKSECRQRVALELSRLSDTERLAVSLYYFDEMRMRQIGEIIGVNESRISQIITGAERLLRKRLTPWRQSGHPRPNS